MTETVLLFRRWSYSPDKSLPRRLIMMLESAWPSDVTTHWRRRLFRVSSTDQFGFTGFVRPQGKKESNLNGANWQDGKWVGGGGAEKGVLPEQLPEGPEEAWWASTSLPGRRLRSWELVDRLEPILPLRRQNTSIGLSPRSSPCDNYLQVSVCRR